MFISFNTQFKDLAVKLVKESTQTDNLEKEFLVLKQVVREIIDKNS
jgi:hypothetical protein